MPFFFFCSSLLLMLFSLSFDLRAKRLLHQGLQTETTRTLLRYWPLQILVHLVMFYLVASAPVVHKRLVQVRAAVRAIPGPVIPSFPPVAIEGKKDRVEHL